MNDFASQAAFVVRAVPNILSQIDNDILSPTWGCAHLAYWRDKTSDVCDIRRQEAMLTLAMVGSRDYGTNQEWLGSSVIHQAVSALATYWIKAQYPDGSFDEWYKGERAYAAAAFGAYAVARTLEIYQNKFDDKLRDSLILSLRNTCEWLMKRNDLFKTNHQAVGAAAMAWSGKILCESKYTKRASEKLESIVNTQYSNGFFPEVGCFDIGYTFLTVEYSMMAILALNDRNHLGNFVKAIDSALNWLHPDITIGSEYGICHNPYISRIAAVLMAEHSPKAAWLFNRLKEKDYGYKGIYPTLADDLRLLRWSYQPLFAYDLFKDSDNIKKEEVVPLASPASEDFVEETIGLARFNFKGYKFLFSANSGGLLRFFNKDGSNYTDFGYAIRFYDNTYATNFSYNPKIIFNTDNNAIGIDASVCKVKKFFPSYLARIILHLTCSTAFGSRLTRKLIDIVRKNKSTAINQSSVNISGKSSIELNRVVYRKGKYIDVVDKITCDKQFNDICLLRLTGDTHGLMSLHEVCIIDRKCITIKTRYNINNEGLWTNNILQED